MTALKLKDIPGLMLEKHNLKSIPLGADIAINWKSGFNEALTIQGEVSITLNRERLSKIIYLENRKQTNHLTCYQCDVIAQALISAQKDLIEVVK